MRRIATTLMATCLLFFVACSDEGDVVTIYNGDTFTSDYKASQMFSTLSLYENIARQPEMVKELMRATAKLAQYDTITAIAPLDKEAEVERFRGKNVGGVFFAGFPACRKRMMILFGLPRSFLGQPK